MPLLTKIELYLTTRPLSAVFVQIQTKQYIVEVTPIPFPQPHLLIRDKNTS